MLLSVAKHKKSVTCHVFDKLIQASVIVLLVVRSMLKVNNMYQIRYLSTETHVK